MEEKVRSTLNNAEITPEQWYNWLEVLVQNEKFLVKKKLKVRKIINFQEFERRRDETLKKVKKVFQTINKTLPRLKKIKDPKQRLKRLRALWMKALNALYDEYAFDMNLRRNDPQKLWHPQLKPRDNIADVYEKKFEDFIIKALNNKVKRGKLISSKIPEIKSKYIEILCSTARIPYSLRFLNDHLIAFLKAKEEVKITGIIKRYKNGEKNIAESIKDIKREITSYDKTSFAFVIKKLSKSYYQDNLDKTLNNLLQKYSEYFCYENEIIKKFKKQGYSTREKRKVLKDILLNLPLEKRKDFNKIYQAVQKIIDFNIEDDINHFNLTTFRIFIKLANEIIQTLYEVTKKKILVSFPNFIPTKLTKEIETCLNSIQ